MAVGKLAAAAAAAAIIADGMSCKTFAPEPDNPSKEHEKLKNHSSMSWAKD